MYEDFTNRTYKGKTATAANATDLDLVRDTRKAMGDKPVVVAVQVAKPMVFGEFEAEANAILATFGFGLNWSGVIDDARTQKYE